MSAQTASVNRVLKPQSRAILGLMRLDFLSVQAFAGDFALVQQGHIGAGRGLLLPQAGDPGFLALQSAGR